MAIIGASDNSPSRFEELAAFLTYILQQSGCMPERTLH
jgi:hypothetical protein